MTIRYHKRSVNKCWWRTPNDKRVTLKRKNYFKSIIIVLPLGRTNERTNGNWPYPSTIWFGPQWETFSLDYPSLLLLDSTLGLCLWTQLDLFHRSDTAAALKRYPPTRYKNRLVHTICSRLLRSADVVVVGVSLARWLTAALFPA